MDERPPQTDAPLDAARLWQTTRQLAERTMGPVFFVWLAATAGLLAVLRALLDSFGAAGGADVFGRAEAVAAVLADGQPVVLGLIVALVALTTLQRALWRPAYLQATTGERLRIPQVLAMAIGRMPAAFLARQVVQIVSALPTVIALLVGATFATFVELPIAFALAPTTFLVIARRMSLGAALGRALRIARRHWAALFVVQGGLYLMAVALQQALQTLSTTGAAAAIGQMSMLLIYAYLEWIGLGALFMAADRATPETTR